MAKKFTEIEKGTFQKLGKEYKYVMEVGEDFNGKKDVRVRIIEEKPIIRKVRTRYDPEIQLFGDKKASMNISLGYSMKEIDRTIRFLKHVFLLPLYSIAFLGFIGMVFYYIFRLPSSFIPKWSMIFLAPLLIVLIHFCAKSYLKIVLNAMAEYLKAKDLKKLLLKEGYGK